MIIKVDKEAMPFITDFCHLALKAGGIQNLDAVNKILNNLEEIKNDKEINSKVEKSKTNTISEGERKTDG